MIDGMRAVVDTMAERVRAKEAELIQLKKAVNVFCRDAGMDPLYVLDDAAEPGMTLRMRPDEYYGKPFATAARDYLKRRGQAVSAEDILSGLTQGSFDFDGIGWNEENRLRTLAASLAKNTAIFHKLPSGLIGLKEWYPEAVDRKKATKKATSTDGATTDKVTTTTEEPTDTDDE
jgi:hypothetical protein